MASAVMSPTARGASFKIVAVAKNYAKHKVEMGGTPARLAAPAFFLKPASSVVPPGQPIVRPAGVLELHHEVELGVVIGAVCSRMPASADWRAYVGGYVLALDMTARDLQARAKAEGMPWTQAKCYDTFTPMSRLLAPAELPDPHDVELFLAVDGAPRQRGSTSCMLHRIPELLRAISAVMTLQPGDVVLTGTPEGVGPVEPGSVISAGITGVVTAEWPVVQQQQEEEEKEEEAR